MLFGAVALVGVIGAATMTLVRGPLSTVSAVNQRAKADSQLAIATKLATIAAAQQPLSGNCDAAAADTFIEPVPATVATPAPAGGGQLPTSFGASQVDPWGTPYGYCVWDLGQAVGDPACDDGNASTAPYLTGGNSGAQPVFVVMSAGPDRIFQTQCNAWADAVPSNATTLIDKPASSDDVLAALTYEEAQNAADGLWSIKTGDPGTITTDKNVEFASGSTATFQGTAQFAPNSRLDLGGVGGAGLFLLPNQMELLDADCTGANSGALRINTTSGFNVLEMCDPAVPGFVALGGAGATVSAIDDLSDAASGTADKFLFLGDGAGLNFDSSSGFNNIGIGINAGAALIGGSGNIVIGNDADTNLATTTDSIVIGNGVTATGSNTMKIGEFLYGSSVYSSSGGMLGIGAAPSVTLDVAGAAEANRFQIDSNTYMDDSSGSLILGAGGSTRVTIENAGNVGIGVADPSVALDVSGDAEISGDAFADQFISTVLGNAGTPNFTFNTATNSGLYYQSSGMGFSIGGLNEMTLTSSGLTVDGF
ncbi:MAG: hypothetical protein HYU57_03825, partial [Micavibrio aeruginosavorus]|nr:hypothetical protein [Micavibrio aeruginosavorus]